MFVIKMHAYLQAWLTNKIKPFCPKKPQKQFQCKEADIYLSSREILNSK